VRVSEGSNGTVKLKSIVLREANFVSAIWSGLDMNEDEEFAALLSNVEVKMRVSRNQALGTFITQSRDGSHLANCKPYTHAWTPSRLLCDTDIIELEQGWKQWILLER
jgi:hypothetical protein